MTLKQIKFLSDEFAFISFKVRKNINMTPLFLLGWRIKNTSWFIVWRDRVYNIYVLIIIFLSCMPLIKRPNKISLEEKYPNGKITYFCKKTFLKTLTWPYEFVFSEVLFLWLWKHFSIHYEHMIHMRYLVHLWTILCPGLIVVCYR